MVEANVASGMEPGNDDAAVTLAVATADIPVSYYVLPPLRPELIDRDLVVKRALDGARPVLEVSAPPGFGKSSLIRLCAESDPRPYAWVQLTQADGDPVHLARHIALALGRIDPLSDDEVSSLLGAAGSAASDLFLLIANTVAERSPCVLVLDDVHLLTDTSSARAVAELSAALPTESTIALVGRSNSVALGRQRMAGRVHRVGVDDLAMCTSEAAELLERVGLVIDDDDLLKLVDFTEGWPGGLHLASLVLAQGRSLQEFSGRDELVAEYLVEEVLAGSDPALVSFMEGSAVLDSMDAEELADLLEQEGCEQQLRVIEESGNLLLIPLDHEGRRYRYHHLLRDHLLERLHRSSPGRASRLEGRACEIRAKSGDVDQAVRHAVRAGDRERAAGLVLGAALDRWFDGRVALLGEWLLLLSEDAVEQHPEAAIAAAWFAIASGDRPAAVRACEAASRSDVQGPLADGSPSAEVALAAARMIMAEGGVDAVIDDAEIVRRAGGPERNPWWTLATGTQGSAYAMLGELDLARVRLEEAVTASSGAPYIDAVGQAQLALLALHDGRIDDGEHWIRSARATADRHHLDRFPPAVAVYAIDALFAALARRPEHARRTAAVAGATIDQMGGMSPRTALLAQVLLARTAVTLGDRGEAQRWIAEARHTRSRDGSATFLNAQLDELVNTVGSSPDGEAIGVEPLTAAERRVLAYLPTHLPLGLVASELHLSRNTVKTHTTAIYRKLGVTSRAQAVTAARSAGLLP